MRPTLIRGARKRRFGLTAAVSALVGWGAVDAMVRAIDWAIEHELDVLTYSVQRFSAATRPRLDSAVDRALAHGIVTVFIHYPHLGNVLPTWLGPVSGDDERTRTSTSCTTTTR